MKARHSLRASEFHTPQPQSHFMPGDDLWLAESPTTYGASGSLVSPATPSSWASPGGVILRSDSKSFDVAQRIPKAMQSPKIGRRQSKSFVDFIEDLEEARSHSKADLIPNSESELVLRLTAMLKQMGLAGKWRIPSAMRKVLLTDLGISTRALLENLVIVAQHLAVPVISVFHVGAVGLGASGDIYLGTNVEISSGLYSSNVCGFHYTLHAEQTVVLNMFERGEKALVSIHISHVPCGMCRQFMAELPGFREIEVWTPQIGEVKSLGELLPYAFGPADLGISRTMIPRAEANPVSLSRTSEAILVDPELAKDAEVAAQKAHAPYTSSFAGAVLRLRDGRRCSGYAAESAAFNPSVSPMQMALLSLWVHGGQLQDVESACLAEDPSSPITYKGSDGALLAAVAPWASLWLIPLESTAACQGDAFPADACSSLIP